MVIFTGQYWIAHSVNETSPTSAESIMKIQPVTSSVPAKMKKNTDVRTSVSALPRADMRA